MKCEAFWRFALYLRNSFRILYNIFDLEINKFYDFDLEVVISKYSNIKILDVHSLNNEKKGFFK